MKRDCLLAIPHMREVGGWDFIPDSHTIPLLQAKKVAGFCFSLAAFPVAGLVAWLGKRCSSSSLLHHCCKGIMNTHQRGKRDCPGESRWQCSERRPCCACWPLPTTHCCSKACFWQCQAVWQPCCSQQGQSSPFFSLRQAFPQRQRARGLPAALPFAAGRMRPNLKSCQRAGSTTHLSPLSVSHSQVSPGLKNSSRKNGI